MLQLHTLIFLAQFLSPFPGPAVPAAAAPSGPALVSASHGCAPSVDSGMTATITVNMTGANFGLACTSAYNSAGGHSVLTDNCGTVVGGVCTGASSNTWTPLTTYPQGAVQVTMWYAANPHVGSGFVLKNATSNSNPIYPAVCGGGFSGMATTNTLDAGPPTTDAGTGSGSGAANVGSITTHADGELVGVCALSSTTTTGSTGIDSGFSAFEKTDGNSGQNFGPLGWSYLIKTTAGTINPLVTPSPNAAMALSEGAFKHQ